MVQRNINYTLIRVAVAQFGRAELLELNVCWILIQDLFEGFFTVAGWSKLDRLCPNVSNRSQTWGGKHKLGDYYDALKMPQTISV